MATSTYSYGTVPMRVPMKPSPSCTYNNLTLSGANLFYAHATQACTLQIATAAASTPVSVRKVECQCQDWVHTVKALPHGETGFVLLATEGGVQVWDKLAHYLLFIWQFPQPSDSELDPKCASEDLSAQGVGTRHTRFARGAAINIARDGQTHICFGCSAGQLHVMQVDDVARFTKPTSFKHHKAAITALGSAYQSRHGRSIEGMDSSLVSADESGAITVWQAQSASSYIPLYELGTCTIPAVSLGVRHDSVIAARLDGTIHIYSMRTKNTQAEICAHSRWLTAMDLHPTKDLVVSGAEDGTIAVWTLPIGAQQTSALMSAVWMHGAVTGVAFCGATLDDVAVVAYDTDEVQIFTTNRPT